MSEEAELREEKVEKSLLGIPGNQLTSLSALNKIPFISAHLDLDTSKSKIHDNFSLSI